MASSSIPAGRCHGDPTRRDFLMVANRRVGAPSVPASWPWPFIKQSQPPPRIRWRCRPSKVNVAPVQVGQAITVKWRGKATVHPPTARPRKSRQPKGGAECRKLRESADRQCAAFTDTAPRRLRPEWLIMIGGLAPISAACRSANNPGDPKGRSSAGWFCTVPTVSMYDTSGRIRKGPAAAQPRRFPGYLFTSDTLGPRRA